VPQSLAIVNPRDKLENIGKIKTFFITIMILPIFTKNEKMYKHNKSLKKYAIPQISRVAKQILDETPSVQSASTKEVYDP